MAKEKPKRNKPHSQKFTCVAIKFAVKIGIGYQENVESFYGLIANTSNTHAETLHLEETYCA